MVNNISGLPPVVLDKSVQEVEPNNQDLGKDALTVAGKKESNAQRMIDEQAGSNAEQHDKLIIGKEEDDKGGTNTNAVDYSKLADIVKTTMGNENYNIEFIKDDVADKMVMQVIDNQTQEVVKQFPPEITLKIARIVAKLLETTGQVTNATV